MTNAAPPHAQAYSTTIFHNNVTAQHMAVLQQHNQHLAQLLNNAYREAMNRNLVTQNQRGRAQAGMRGIGDQTAGNGYNTATGSGRASPAPGLGQPTIPGGLSAPDVHHALQRADATHATQIMTDAMHRSASSASLQSRTPNRTGLATPDHPGSGVANASTRATPEIDGAPSGDLGSAETPSPSQGSPGYEVYILSSPEGPRALLFNHTTSAAYYTPRLRTPASLPQLRSGLGFTSFANEAHSSFSGHFNGQVASLQQSSGPQTTLPRVQNGPTAQHAQPEVNHGAPHFHPNNPAALPLPHMLHRVLPHLWLILRLSFFVWIVTTPQTSWTRWLVIVGMAVALFIHGTGVLDGFISRAWQPLGRLENFLPRLHDDRARHGTRRFPEQGEGPISDTTGQDPDPAQLAARLIAERRGQEPWLVRQVRRVERAGVLFLASIAPGVAERHIANQEAEVRAERDRREAEERAERERREAEEASAVAAQPATENSTGAGAEVSSQEEGVVGEGEASGHANHNVLQGTEGEGELRHREKAGQAHEPVATL